MEKLNTDIFYEICKRLSIKEISRLQKTNSKIYNKIIVLHNNILTNELNDLHNNKTNILLLKYNFYEYLFYFLNSNFFDYTKFTNIIICNMYQRIISYLSSISHRKLPTIVFDDSNNRKRFSYWRPSDLRNYPNKLELFFLYNFINIECFINYNIDYSFKFLKMLDSNKRIIDDTFYQLKFKYYKNILYIEKYDIYFMNFSFEKLYQMTPYITTIFILKRLFGYKLLDLKYSKLLLCCENCVIQNIHYMCNFKMSFYHDDLISYNYTEILNFLKRENKLYYHILIEREKFLVNKKIYVTNPRTNKNIKITDASFNVLQNDFNNINLNRIIHNKRKRLIQKYFR